MPKGRTVKQVRAKAKREDAKQLKAFRDAVWKRERDKAAADGFLLPEHWAECQGCGRLVTNQGPHDRGHVHHIRSRRHAETRYDVLNGKLLCQRCHQKIHGREF